jgi:C-terminal processing protease CtpA/Prc
MQRGPSRLVGCGLLLTVALLTGRSIAAGGADTTGGVNWDEAMRLRSMLKDAYNTVRTYYDDPNFQGLDWTNRYQQFQTRLTSATSFSNGLGVIAAFLDGLGDSHTNFQPPPWASTVDYGYDVGMIGNDPFILRMRPGTDAATKLRAGDRIVSLNGNDVTRESFGRMQYVLTRLAPLVGTDVVVETASGEIRSECVMARVTNTQARRVVGGPGTALQLSDLTREWDAAKWPTRQRSIELGSVMIWKMPSFFAEVMEIDRLIARARQHDTLILDLRGNPGGLLEVLQRLVGSVFQDLSIIGTQVSRTGTSLLTARSRGKNAFSGNIIVLVDSGSGSSAELFARVIQLDERGIVLGDQTAGVVREGRLFSFAQGDRVLLPYAVAVTNADILMKNGESLEHRGVTPDELILPTQDDLAAGRDPVLARALELAGQRITPADAAHLIADKR